VARPHDPGRAAPEGPAAVTALLAGAGYLADHGLSTVVFLALALGRPLFLEGEPGSGKTELARALAAATGAELIRLQCYEGIDAAQAVYEWDYPRQLLHLRANESAGLAAERAIEAELYEERFLIRRPLLRAISAPPGTPPPILLVDEVDRSDDEFEAFLLEILSDYAVSIPELGTVRAEVQPTVVLTSNRTRDVHDALKRRSLYHWVGHPSFEREVAIVQLRSPEIPDRLAREVTAAVAAMREQSLYKPPGVSETIDWANALAALGAAGLDAALVEATIGTVLKYREDVERVLGGDLEALVERAVARA
jgi:MoxR-like ATPase